MGGVTETCVGGEGAVPPSSSHPQTDTSHTLYLDLSAAENPSHFHGLITETNYEHLKRFVMLGMHSKVRRGQMSQICDISPLRVI